MNSEFIEQHDPNLRYLGLTCLEEILDEKTKVLFAPRIMQKFKQETEYSISQKLIQIMKQIVDVKNHKQILTSLFDKFKSEKSLLSIETILEIE